MDRERQHTELPGSQGEHALQQTLGTVKRARAFYNNQVLDHVNAYMRDYLDRQEIMFVSTADAAGNCDCTFQARPPGFVKVLNARTVAYPEYRANGVMASMGNLIENPRIGLLFLDFFATTVACISTARQRSSRMATGFRWTGGTAAGSLPRTLGRGRRRRGYIHCSKHVPQLMTLPKDIDWGTDDMVKKGGAFFKAKASPAPWKRPDSLAT